MVEFDIFNKGQNSPLPDGPAKLAELRQAARALSQSEEAPLYQMPEKLATAINVALCTGYPLLLTGEPGAGKTQAAFAISYRLGLDEPLVFHVQSDSRAKDLRYTFKSIDYFRAMQLWTPDQEKPRPSDKRYLEPGKLWQALRPGASPKVLLIDEIDKAPRDFPNDLLHELERLEFEVPEHEESNFKIRLEAPELRPLIVITSNAERRLPEPFLRRCVYHHLRLADLTEVLQKAIEGHLGPIADSFGAETIQAGVRLMTSFAERPEIRKKPSLAELRSWFVAVHFADAAVRADATDNLKKGNWSKLCFLGTLFKTQDDLLNIERR